VRALVLALALVLAGCASAPSAREPARPLDVPYVATDERVVTAMLELAGVTRDDVVMDLGCGDGRIVIAAAQRFGARGIGIDLDPKRIDEANANARAARVQSLVRFVEGDIFDVDVSAATVVMLYLLPEINLELRPKLLRELKPGTRVVSHNFDMGDWEPERTVRVPLRPGRVPILYLWRIPAR
jgi:SAM-dependent methyltransferase